MLKSYCGAIRYWTCAHKVHCFSHASSPQMQHCYALPSTVLPLIFSWIQVFFSWWYCVLYSPSSFMVFPTKVSSLQNTKNISWMFIHGLHAYYSTTCYDAVLPLNFSPDSRFFQLVLYPYTIYTLYPCSSEWGFHPVHTTRFPHSNAKDIPRMCCISQSRHLFRG